MSFLTTLRKLGNHIGAYKVHLCPVVKGQITDHGKPLANVKIERRLRFSDGKTVEDYTFTNNDGFYILPEANIRSNQPAVPLAETFTSQLIKLTHRNKNFNLWATTFHELHHKKEFSDKLSLLNADLENDEVFFKFKDLKNPNIFFEASSICRWKENYNIINLDNHFDLSDIDD